MLRASLRIRIPYREIFVELCHCPRVTGAICKNCDEISIGDGARVYVFCLASESSTPDKKYMGAPEREHRIMFYVTAARPPARNYAAGAQFYFQSAGEGANLRSATRGMIGNT